MTAKKTTKKAPAAKGIKIAKGTVEKKPKAGKPAAEKKPKAKKEPKAKKPSALDAAAKVLGEAKAPMNCQEMIKAMAEKGYWTSPGGQTPHATLYSAILREISVKGKDARFKKTERGKFALKA
jgi:hypothetical protein